MQENNQTVFNVAGREDSNEAALYDVEFFKDDWRLSEERALLLIIDIQEKLSPVIYEREEIEKNAAILAEAFAAFACPVLVTEQYPKGLGPTVESVKLAADKAEAKYFEKTSFTAATEDVLLSIEEADRDQIVLCGMETHICVWQTAIDLSLKGYEVFLALDAAGSRKEKHKKWAAEAMQAEGVHLASVETILYEMLEDSKHPQFKTISALIK